MIQDKNIIYVNGDSFTQGCDVEYHLRPTFKKNFSVNEILSIPIKQLVANQRAMFEENSQWDEANPEEYKKLMEYQKEMRWSSRLEKILNRPVFNISSKGGSSMYAISYRTIADIIALKNAGYNITDVIIQITKAGRYSFFKNTLDVEEPIYDTQKATIKKYNIVSFTAGTDVKEYQRMIEGIIMNETFEYSEYRLLHDLLMFKHALIAITGARVIFVDSLFFKKTLGDKFFTFNNCELSEENHVFAFKKQMDNDIELSMIESVDPDEPDTMTTGLHFTAKVHDIFAKKIAERYFNE
jgi:hypothetical protein